MRRIRVLVTLGVTTPPPLKEISSRDLWKEGGSKEWRNEYDECLHGKIDDKDKLEYTKKHCETWRSLSADVIKFNITISFIEETRG
jgi:hypothetical protein